MRSQWCFETIIGLDNRTKSLYHNTTHIMCYVPVTKFGHVYLHHWQFASSQQMLNHVTAYFSYAYFSVKKIVIIYIDFSLCREGRVLCA